MQPGDIVWVPFPHVGDNRLRSRPSVVVATRSGGPLALFWGVMITAARNDAWPGDMMIADHEGAGLPIPSRIRPGKIATLPMASASLLGRLPDAEWAAVRRLLVATLGFEGMP